jgi:hypothetical protein
MLTKSPRSSASDLVRRRFVFARPLDNLRTTSKTHFAAWRALGDVPGAGAGTTLDKGVEPDALAKSPNDENKGLMDRARHRERVPNWKASNRGRCT